jgi:hypothetical protein
MASNLDPPIFAFQVAGIAGICHNAQSDIIDFYPEEDVF